MTDRCLVHGNELHFDMRSGFDICYECEREEQTRPTPPRGDWSAKAELLGARGGATPEPPTPAKCPTCTSATKDHTTRWLPSAELQATVATKCPDPWHTEGEAVTSSGAQPPARKVYKWEEKPERCPVCDSPCFITSGGMNLTCYHCYLAEEFVKLWEAAQEFYASDSAWKESSRTKARDHLGKVLKETEPSDKMLEISDAQGSSPEKGKYEE